jgi:hypothetical protein
MNLDQERISKMLGSSRVVPIQERNSQGPLDLLRLAVEVKRLQETRADDDDIPPHFSKERWQEIKEIAQALQQQGANVTAEQLADVLLQNAMSQLRSVLSAISPSTLKAADTER